MDDPRCILIVEADILVRSPLADYLRECGYRVLEAVDGLEARKILADTASGAVDIVLANTAANGDNGFALASWIRANFPDIEVALAGTVTKAAEKASDLCEDGPSLSKPYDHSLVLDQIRRLLAARDRKKLER